MLFPSRAPAAFLDMRLPSMKITPSGHNSSNMWVYSLLWSRHDKCTGHVGSTRRSAWPGSYPPASSPGSSGAGCQNRFPALGLAVLRKIGIDEMFFDSVFHVHVTFLGDHGELPPLCEEMKPRAYYCTLFTDIAATLFY